MARRRVFNAGPTVPNGMQQVSSYPVRSSRGVFLRQSPGFDQARTVKSTLGRRPHRGIEPPGFHMPDQVTPRV